MLWCMLEIIREKNCSYIIVWMSDQVLGLFLATGSLPNNIYKKLTLIVHRNFAHCCTPWLCQPLWHRKHFNSPLSSICACGRSRGCRRPPFIIADRLQIRWFLELWERGRGVWGRASDGVGQTVRAATVHFPPQQLTDSPLLFGAAWFSPTIVCLVGSL